MKRASREALRDALARSIDENSVDAFVLYRDNYDEQLGGPATYPMFAGLVTKMRAAVPQ